MKKFNYIYLILTGILIMTMSLTWKGIINMLKSSYSPNIQGTYKTLKVLNDKYEFKLPADWQIREQNFSGGEIKYHGDFTSPDKRTRGIVEVWDINMPLIKFLNQSKESITGVVEFKNYKIQPVKLGAYNGYLLEYSRLGSDNKYYNALEYFIQDRNMNFFRISFYIPSNFYSEKFKSLTRDIASTLIIK